MRRKKSWSSARWWVVNGVAAAPPASGCRHRRLDLDEAAVIQVAPHSRDDAGALAEDVPRLFVGDEVPVALPVALLDVREAVPLLRRRLQRLRQHREGRRLDRDLAGASAEQGARRANDIAEVAVLQRLEVAFADVVAAEVHLDAPFAIAQVQERRLAHVAQRRDPARDAYGGRVALGRGLPRFEGANGGSRRVGTVVAGRVGVDAPFAKPV